MKKLMLAVVAAVAMALVSGEATAQNGAMNRLAVEGTAWVTQSTNPDGKEVLNGFIFREDGTFVHVLGMGGKVSKLEGKYRVTGNVIKVTVEGEEFFFKVISFSSERMVIDGRKGLITWDRYRPEQK